MAEVRIYGVRHHGPGSALSLRAALDGFRPDCVLIEGPPDADALIPLAAAEGAEPPLALMVYRADRPRRCAFFPFARFSPEWVAIRHALAGGVPVRFMDLPQAVQFAVEDGAAAAAGTSETGGAIPAPDGGEADEAGALPGPSAAAVQRDPLGELARAAGYDDGERWWDAFVESRTRGGEDAFAAVAEAMAALREAARGSERPSDAAEALREEQHEERREAHMRSAIRAAAKGGSTRIAAVCGAWHAPALLRHGARGQAGADAAALRGLPRVKVAAAWAPWSYERLAAASGYRAGVLSPEWYDLLWSHGEGAEGSGRAAHGVAARWLARAAALLRAEDLDASPASVIEAVRLAEALASFRGRARPALEDVDEAAGAALCFADPAPLALIRRKLVVGERLGVAPPGGPRTPLEADFAAQCRTLRLAPEAAARELELDLRRETDLARSHLLNRLDLLGVPWGRRRGTRGRGTFRELWALRWAPEWAVDLVAASAEGATVAEAAAARVAAAARGAARVADLAALIGRLLDADLPDASAAVVRAISDRAALSGDVFDLMAALPPLAELARYGSVRSSDTEAVAAILRGIVPRVAAGLVPACQSLDDAAAAAARARIEAAEAAVALTGEATLTSAWRDALRALADQDHVHGLVVGRAARILFDAGAMDGGEAGERLALALSRAAGAAPAAAWIAGFLDGGGTALIHGAGLLAVVDGWLCGLDAALFDELLPLVRRTFSTMPKPERRAIGEALRRIGGPVRGDAPDRPDDGRTFDPGRAALALPMLRLLFAPVEGSP